MECALERAEKIILDKIREFESSLKTFADGGRERKVGLPLWGFPVLISTENTAFDEQVHYDELIENYVWRDLVNGVLQGMFSEEFCRKNDIEVSWTFFHPQLSMGRVEKVESCNRIEFFIKIAGRRTGYRYTNPHLIDEDKVKKWFELSEIDEMVVLDFSVADRKRPPWANFISPKFKDEIRIESFQKFFEEFFGNEAYEFYITKVRESIERVYNYVGSKTIPSLNSQFLGPFVNTVTDEVGRWDYHEDGYQVLDFSKLNNEYKKIIQNTADAISELDFRIMREYFISQKRYLALSGNESFAKSFITSEYLVKNLLASNKLDLTSIVSGYLKSVEQLLYKLVLLTMELWPNNSLWIKADNNKVDEKALQAIKGKKLPLKVEFKDCFVTTFKVLVGVLEHTNNEDRWLVSEGARKRIIVYLKAFCDECRNEHFHKDNIDDPEEVKKIQSNTYLLLFYLLGAYKLTGDDKKDRELLGVVNKEFDNLYRVMHSRFGQGHFYRMNFKDQEPILVAMPAKQDNPVSDDSGKLQNTRLRFIKVSEEEWKNPELANWGAYDRDMSSERVVYINDDNIPEKINLLAGGNDEIPVEWERF